VLIVDLDGVLRRFEPVEAIEHRHGLPVGSLLGTAFRPDLLEPAVTGLIDDDRWRAEVAAVLVAEHGPAAAAAVAEWSRSPGSVDADVLAVVRRYRRRAPVALLSNATTRLPADLARLGLDAEVDRIFASYALGVAKPDPRVFALVCAQLGAAPADCLFVDDTTGHVTAARAAGLVTHHFETVDGLTRFLGV
jgi:putative hydrolase of the HAD superfamily